MSDKKDNEIKEVLVVLETAKLAKEKGCNLKTIWFYRIDSKELKENSGRVPIDYDIEHSMAIAAPTQSLLQKWLREVHNMNIVIDSNHSGWYWIINKTNGTFIAELGKDEAFLDDFEQALEEGLYFALKLIE